MRFAQTTMSSLRRFQGLERCGGQFRILVSATPSSIPAHDPTSYRWLAHCTLNYVVATRQLVAPFKSKPVSLRSSRGTCERTACVGGSQPALPATEIVFNGSNTTGSGCIAKKSEEIARSSESYVNRSDCTHSINLVKKSGDDPVYYSD
jgi:hypothetical protein